VIDYGVPRRDKPTLKKTNYKELKSGKLNLSNRNIKVTSISSLKQAHKICNILKKWISEGEFFLTQHVKSLPTDTIFKPMKQTDAIFVENVTNPAITCTENDDVKEVALKLIKHSTNQVVVVDNENRLLGIVTTWDVTRSIANGISELKDIIVRKVHTVSINDPIEVASKLLAKHNISSLPVVDQKMKLLGIITSEDISKLYGGSPVG
jgi:CBS domain-containing protein